MTIHISGQDPAGDYFPRIELVRDSFGNSSENAREHVPQQFALETGLTLRPGDVVRFTCRGVDPQNRPLIWTLGVPGVRNYELVETDPGGGAELVWEVSEADIRHQAVVAVTLKSSGEYFRHGPHQGDAVVGFLYQVMPPLA